MKENTVIKRNEQQLRFLYGEEAVEALKEGIKKAIKHGNVKVISFDKIDKELERLSRK